ncbi:MAG: metallophosphoesterase family protein [Bacilli bacterium]|nr:metallophosphoesterase family protein [Bacilli bacterium]
MDKIAIISDIHGNLEALKSVLDDIKERNINRIFCLGDIIAKGTHQQECVDLVKENCEVILRGNCDEYFTSNIDLLTKTQSEVDRIIWNKNKLNEETRKYLSNLPYCYEFYMSGRFVRLVHAHPEKIDKFTGNIDKIDRLYELFLPSSNTISDKKADILIYGHIHTQYVQKIYNRMIINIGSVGNAIDVFRNDEKDGDVKNTTVANYLILSGNFDSKNIDEKISYELVCVPYDIDKELNDNDDNIEFESYEEEIRKGKYRDMTKIYKSFELRDIDKDKI